MEEVVTVVYPINPRCHGNMIYEASIPNISAPQLLVYRCQSCRGQAIQDVYGAEAIYRKDDKFYTPKPDVVAPLEELKETAEDDVDVLPDTESQLQ